MVEQLRKHVRLLEEFWEKAFREGNRDYLGEVAGKLRLLATESRSNVPLLIKLLEETEIDIPIVLDEPGPPRQPLSLEQYMALEVEGHRLQSGEFHMFTASELVGAWAQQTGASHEDWGMDEGLRIALEVPVYLAGMQAGAASLQAIAGNVLSVARQFLAALERGGSASEET